MPAGLITTVEENIEHIVLKASKKAITDFKSSKLDYEYALSLIKKRNQTKRKPLALKDILENAFQPIKDKNEMDYNYQFAQAYYATEEYTKALHHLRKAKNQKLNPQYLQVAGLLIKTCTALAKQNNEKKYWTEAENNCKRVIKSTDNQCEFVNWALQELSDIYLAQEEHEKAKKLLEKNAEDYHSLYLNLAEFYAEQDNKEAMFTSLKQFLRKNPAKWKIIHFNKKLKKFEQDSVYHKLWLMYEGKAESLNQTAMFSPWNLKGIFARTA